jgi:hypothetical protein
LEQLFISLNVISSVKRININNLNMPLKTMNAWAKKLLTVGAKSTIEVIGLNIFQKMNLFYW